ncbi:hypothetical protein, partial [Kitasatospora sp. NPDC088346]|uniref:hypothetical protein n=1 Tax=Kitasatospora sp. NPDC088346 TaxID=3364073 RepID=UPI0037F54B07
SVPACCLEHHSHIGHLNRHQSGHFACTTPPCLAVGDTLRTPDDQPVRIINKRDWAGLQSTYNLTIANAHTYYVLAGVTPLLVHNSGKVPELCNIGSHLVLGIAPYSDNVAKSVNG